MYIVQDYATAVFFCIVTMFCWGSWANTTKLAKNWRFELFYWDYVWGIVLFSLLTGLTLGSYGTLGRSFLDDIRQAIPSSILSAMFGGIIFNLANILLGAAIAIAGMSVAFPVGIGLALVLGVVVNYMGEPVGNSLVLFGGVLLVTASILLSASAYKKLSTVKSGVSTKGLVLAILAGLLMGFFYRFVANAMSSDFLHPEAGKLTPYSAVFFFALGILASNLVFNSVLIYKPFEGEPLSYKDYFSGSLREHATGILGGVVWCMGMSLNILAAGQAGFAISYGLGQGATMVAACWGVYVWKEFKDAPQGTNRLLQLMFAGYILGLVLIVISRFV